MEFKPEDTLEDVLKFFKEKKSEGCVAVQLIPMAWKVKIPFGAQPEAVHNLIRELRHFYNI